MVAQDALKVKDSNPDKPEVSFGTVDGWTVYQQGGAFKVSLPADEGHPVNNPVRHVRGKVNGYSRQSAHRLRSLCNRIDHSSYPGALFLTLSFDDDHYPASAAEAHRKLDTFCKWLARRFSDHETTRPAKEQKHAPILWRLEFGEETGRAHFHLLVFAGDWVDADTYRSAWGQGFIKVKWSDSRNVWRYVAKYVGKAVEDVAEAPAEGVAATGAQADALSADAAPAAVVPVDLIPAHISPQGYRRWDTTGRIWGIRNPENLVLAPLRWQKIDEDDPFIQRALIILRRRMRNWQKSHRMDKLRSRWRTECEEHFKIEAKIHAQGMSVLSLAPVDFGTWMQRRKQMRGTKGFGDSRVMKSFRIQYGIPKLGRWLSHEDWRRWSIFTPQDWDMMGMLFTIAEELRRDAQDVADGVYQEWKQAAHTGRPSLCGV